jgi:putative transposase
VIRFIDEHRDRRSGKLRWGIEPIAKVLGIAPSTYHAAKKRPPSARAVRDAELKPLILRVWEQNLAVYGADKVWDQLNKDGVCVARCTVERLMAGMGLQGCRRGRVWIRTTEGDDRLDRPADLVERQFRAPAPNRLWVADLTYVKTHSGWVYVAFIVDVFSRMVVGWQASRSLRSDLAIDALEMAVFNRRRAGADLSQLTHHSDRGVQGEINRSSQHLSMTEVCGGATTAGGRQGASSRDAVPRAADASASCRARVLATHRPRQEHRRRRCRCRGVGPRRVALVPSRWRHAAFEPRRTDRPVLVVR